MADLNPRLLRRAQLPPNVQVREHDILAQDLEATQYDVVHCPTCRDDDNDVIPCEGDEAVADLFPHDWTSH